MGKNLYVVDISLSHVINFDLNGDEIIFDPKDQDVHIHSIKVKPGIAIHKFTGKSYYDGNPKDIFHNAITLLNADISNLSPDSLQEPETQENSKIAVDAAKNTNLPKTKHANSSQSKENDGQNIFGDPDDDSGQNIFGDPDDDSGQNIFGDPNDDSGQNIFGDPDDDDDDDDEIIHESYNINQLSLNETNINNSRNLSFMIASRKLNFSKVIELDEKEKGFKIQIIPENVKNFVNYIESKKIKIFISGVEQYPKDEIDFLSGIFPYIDIELEL